MRTVKPPYWKTINHLHPLARGLAGCWLFNEGIGDKLNDLSGNAIYAVVEGAVWIPGRDGNALNFNGTSDYVDCGTDISPSGWTQLTLEAWIKSDVPDINNSIAGWYVSGPGLFMQTKYDSGEGLLVYAGVGGDFAQKDMEITDVWLQAVLVYDGSLVGNANRLKLYVNGLLEANLDFFGTAAIPSSLPVADYGSLLIGDCGTLDRKWDGSIGSIRIWNRALSAEEIALLYREPYSMIRF